MLGFNGGLMGVRRVPTAGAASGAWVPNEQVLARRAGIWPQTITDPTAGLSPALWYDFADETTATTSGTEITAVTSKGSTNWTLTKSATGPQYVTGINSKKCVDWGSPGHNNFLQNTSATSTAIAEIYFVLDGNFGSTFAAYNGLATGTSEGGFLLLGNPGGPGLYSFNFTTAFINGSASDVYSSGVLPTINSPSILRVGRSSGSFNTTDGFQIGNDRVYGGRGWGGLIGEVIVFSTALSSTDRDSLQAWLGLKWNITLV
jgi:hypothetical protein